MFNSKKADTTVTILVLMTLLLCSYSLVMFYISEVKSSDRLNMPFAVTDFYLESDNLEFFMRDLAKGIIEGNQNSLSTEQFIQLFKIEFAEKSKTLLVLEQYSSNIENGDFSDTKIENNKLSFNLKDFSFSKEMQGFSEEDTLYLNYIRDFSFELEWE